MIQGVLTNSLYAGLENEQPPLSPLSVFDRQCLILWPSPAGPWTFIIHVNCTKPTACLERLTARLTLTDLTSLERTGRPSEEEKPFSSPLQVIYFFACYQVTSPAIFTKGGGEGYFILFFLFF